MVGGVENDRAQTIGDALERLEGFLFVDRRTELDAFGAWLQQEEVPILNVLARGGVGKTTLLSAYRRQATSLGREVLSVDAVGIDPSPAGFSRALAPDARDAIAYCNDHHCLILIDSYEDQSWLTGFLQNDFLPALSARTKVAIAGRLPLGPVWARWGPLIRTITLGPLAPSDARTYLERRGVGPGVLMDQIVAIAGGLPLALALAADLVLDLGVTNLGESSEWHLVVHSLAERLIHEVADPDLVLLLEACALLRHFDEPDLKALTALDDVSDAFARLCGLSVVRAGLHGLMLHDDVRRVIGGDLRWRNPERFAQLRQRALSFLGERMKQAPPAERHWLATERMFLWEDAFVHSVLFVPSAGAEVTVTVGGPDHADDAMALERRFQDVVLPQQADVEWTPEYPKEQMLSWMDRALHLPGARVALARTQHGAMSGYSLVLPLFTAAVELLAEDPVLSALLRSWLDVAQPSIPTQAEDATAFYMVQACVIDVEPEATTAALFRDLFGLLSREGTYLATAALPIHRQLFERLGFEAVEGSTSTGWVRGHLFQGYVLDLDRVGFEAWMEALLAGRKPKRRAAADELERELGELLPHWHSDERLEGSSLAPSDSSAEARAAVHGALETARSGAGPDLELALRAVELAYLERAATHERLAERLSVSRSTFYRLLRRGVRALAEELAR